LTAEGRLSGFRILMIFMLIVITSGFFRLLPHPSSKNPDFGQLT
jgi:hypothetical protein